jgi:predicted amidohydrolase
MKISVIQLNSQTNKQKNINEALSIASEAIKADAPDLIALPEMLSFCGGTEDEKKESAESIPLGVTTQALSKFAKDNKIYLHGGSYFESAGDKIYNTSLAFDKNGEIIAKYRKIHLFDITTPNGNDYRESDTVLPGSEIVSYKALNLSIGCSICYDLRFAELYLELAKQQVDIIMVPAAFTLQTGKDHWSTLLRARAIETQSYVVAPGQCGEFPDGDNGMRQTWGRSMIIDPWGNIVAQASDGPGWASAKIDEKYLKNIRSNVPVASHRVL